MGGIEKEILARPIQVADQVIENADLAQDSFKQECNELKTKTQKLAALLQQAARASNELYECPTLRIIDNIEQVLDNALILVTKCCSNGFLKRIFTIIPAAADLQKTSINLENSIRDVSWLLRVSAPAKDHDDESLGLPPIASNEPILGLIWEQVAILHTGTLEERFDAAVSLGSLARDNDRYGGLIIKEGGVETFLKLAKEGHMEGQEHGAKSIGFLCRNSKSVEHIVNCGACFVFARILEDGHMKVQSIVAWVVSEMATHHPTCRDHFARNNVVCLLVNHLAFQTIQEDKCHKMLYCQEAAIKGWEYEDFATKVQMKIMAARASWHLCKGNVSIYRNITESRALLCFALLLENGCHEDVKYYSAMALMEITAIAEQNVELRQSGFNPASPAVKVVVQQLMLKNLEKENSDHLIIPSIKAVGHLAWTVKANETTMIASLVKLLDERGEEVSMEAVIALDKFACPENVLHDNHCKAIIEAGGAKPLVQLVYFSALMVQIPSIILLSHITLHVPDCEVLAQEEVLTLLEISLKRSKLMEEPNIQSKLPRARNRLKLYQDNFID